MLVFEHIGFQFISFSFLYFFLSLSLFSFFLSHLTSFGFFSITKNSVVACEGLTGFCECVPGDTMLKFNAGSMDEALGDDSEKVFFFLFFSLFDFCDFL